MKLVRFGIIHLVLMVIAFGFTLSFPRLASCQQQLGTMSEEEALLIMLKERGLYPSEVTKSAYLSSNKEAAVFIANQHLFPQVEGITFSGAEIDRDQVEALGRNKKITEYEIEEGTPFPLEEFALLTGCQKLTLRDFKISDANFKRMQLPDNLEVLTLDQCNISGIGGLASARSLKHLRLIDCVVEDIEELAKLDRLETITWQGKSTFVRATGDAAPIEKLVLSLPKTLKQLVLRDITNPSLDREIELLFKRVSLKSLHMIGCRCDVSYLKKVPSGLEDIEVVGAYDEAGLEPLLKQTRLTELALVVKQVDSKFISRMLTNNPKLKKLRIGNDRIEKEIFAEVGKLSDLEELTLVEDQVSKPPRGEKATTKPPALLTNWKSMPKLRTLYIDGNFSLNDVDAKVISNMKSLEEVTLGSLTLYEGAMIGFPQCEEIKKLTLSEIRGFDRGQMVAVSQMKKLAVLSLNSVRTRRPTEAFGTVTIEKGDFAVLRNLANLESLNLNRLIFLSDADLNFTGGMKGLRHLSIYNCTQLTDKGIENLAGCPRLTVLELYENKINGEGFAAWTQSPLRELTIYSSPVAAKGVNSIASLKSLRSLVVISTAFSTGKDLDLAKFDDASKLLQFVLDGSFTIDKQSLEAFKKKHPNAVVATPKITP